MSASNTLLRGKKVLVIGGSSGIGFSVAAAALSNGASVVIASSSQARLDAAVERLKMGIEGKDDVVVSGQAFDIKYYPALTEFLTKEAPFDHLVITAGGPPEGHPKPGVDVREQLQDDFDLRYWPALNAAHHIHTNSLIRPGGSLTLSIGAAQTRPQPGWGFGLGAAGAVETATRGLALDLKPLRVNTISPGLVDTELFQNMPTETRTRIMEEFLPKLLVGHVGTPEEVAEAYIFAMKCQYLTGQVIIVDGGGIFM
ncbi:NAD(P)-binding protein [Ceratobasidium sp. AG-I]|nr:NAD(P)-binding protein [Ceratobasidium sp. AG-I]